MKKSIVGMSLLFICLLFLIACNHNEDSNKHNNTVSNEVEQENISDENERSTSNPLEIMSDDSYELFQHGSAELEIVGRYISEDSDENGIIELEANGYKIRFVLVLMHSPVVNENTIYVLGEHENINKDGKQMGIPPSTVKINDDMELRDTFSIGPLEANAETTITSMIILDGAVEPDTFEIIFQKPIELESIEEKEPKDYNGQAWKVMEFQRK